MPGLQGGRQLRDGHAQPLLLQGFRSQLEDQGTHLGQSVYLRDIHGRTDGPPPSVDLAHEKAVGDLVRALIDEGVVTAVHDLIGTGSAGTSSGQRSHRA